MTRRSTLHGKYQDCCHRSSKSPSTSPPAIDLSPPSLRSDRRHSTSFSNMEVDEVTEAPPWSGSSMCVKDHGCDDQPHSHRYAEPLKALAGQNIAPTSPSSLMNRQRDYNEELVELLVEMCPTPNADGLSGEDLAEAFRDATELPPVTRQSLSELDIHSIITNIRLRHDVNFDRDLSFRPNLDGAKGQEKGRVAKRYWTALAAELILYERLHQGSPPLRNADRKQVFKHAQKRIPILFKTVRDVLKSLVPDRDHARVDEHLDVPLLMQAIERGVCDLVRLAEWMAQLLKEHCAPMRDVWVDSMVESIRNGATKRNPEKLVEGLRGLLGILEAMKLDVANHQIRNLKTLLVEDTVNFERHYHLDRLVHGRPRVDIIAAQAWYASAVAEFRDQCSAPSRSPRTLQLEVFVRAVTATLFGRASSDFPDTFYLDQERLRSLKAEIEDLVCFDACMDLFAIIVRELGHDGSISLSTGQQLRSSLSAIMGDALGHGVHSWLTNSENLSLEILRQARGLTEQSQAYDFDVLPQINKRLQYLLLSESSHHAQVLENSLLPQILAGAQRLSSSSPMDLFSNLVSTSPSGPTLPTYVSPLSSADTSTFAHLRPEIAKMADLANRITHIVVLHWRVWDCIAYEPKEEPQSPSQPTHASTDTSINAKPLAQTIQASTAFDQEAQVVASMKTGDAQESGTEAHVARQTSSR